MHPDEKIRLYRVQFQADLWPKVAKAQRWNPRDETRRRDLRARCWAEIGRPDKGEDMPANDAEATALFTLCRHLADPDNITRSMEWDNCKADYRAFNTARQADYWERRGYGPRGSRSLRHRRFAGRLTAQGYATEDPLDRNAANQRLWKMRQCTRRRESKHRHATPDHDLCPF